MTKTTYEYPNSDGNVLFKVVRTDNADGTKMFTQWHITDVEVTIKVRGRDQTFAPGQWVPRAPSWPRPLWRLPDLEWLEDGAPVLVVEGEKAAIRAQAIFGDKLVVTTWAGGSNAVKKTDWSPLKRLRAVHWPDLDQAVFPEGHAQAGTIMPFMMQPGTKAALQAAALSGGALVDIPDDFIEAACWVVPSGWDLADPMPDGFDMTHINAMLRRAFDAFKVNASPLTTPSTAVVSAHEHADVQSTGGEDVPDENEFPWVQMLLTGNGSVRPCFENVARLLTAQTRWDLRFDTFSNRPCIGTTPLDDEHILMISRAVQSRGVIASTTVIGEAVVAAALERRFHPVHDYLDGLTWDGVERLDHWLIDYAGAVDDEYTRAVSRCFLIQAIARIREPGCQADAMLILEGPQGKRKSSLLRTLFGAQWFSDHLPDLSSKDAQLQLLGMWCIEVAELSTLGRSDAAKIKAFLTSRVDRFRPPFGKVAKDFPRSSVFCGTVNPGGSGYLKDPTGARRFWPVAIDGMLDVAALAQLRDQLWAEAQARYTRGEPWWLDDSITAHATDRQEERREDDVWEDRIGAYLSGKTQTTTSDIFINALSISSPADWKQPDQQRIGRIITAMGWHRKQRRLDGRLQWYYAKPSTLL